MSGTLRYAPRAAGIAGSVIDASTSLLARQTHDVVRFAMGSPSPAAIPAADFARLGRELLAAPRETWDYAATEGDPALRAALLRFLAEQGESVPPERLLVTAGGMQGLDLACKLFVGEGDLVAIESPTYTNGSATVSGYGGELLEVPVDDDGMEVERLAALVAAGGRRPVAIYTIPTFQNPAGTSLSLPRRRRLLELAQTWRAVVIEDDPYGLLRFGGEPLPSLRELSGDAPWVVSVHTCSKILAPGLRVGWTIADAEVVARMVDARQSMDTCANVPLQQLVAAYLDAGLIEPHLERLRATYRSSKEAMQQQLEAVLGAEATRWTDPDGGFFLWLTLPDGVDAERLFPTALEEGVAYIPGAAFSPSGRFSNALRLCFATSSPERIAEGIVRLERALTRVYGAGWRDGVTR